MLNDTSNYDHSSRVPCRRSQPAGGDSLFCNKFHTTGRWSHSKTYPMERYFKGSSTLADAESALKVRLKPVVSPDVAANFSI